MWAVNLVEHGRILSFCEVCSSHPQNSWTTCSDIHLVSFPLDSNQNSSIKKESQMGSMEWIDSVTDATHPKRDELSFWWAHESFLFKEPPETLVWIRSHDPLGNKDTIAGALSARMSSGASSRPWQMGYAAWPSAKRFHRLQFKTDCFGMKYSPGCGYLIMTGRMPVPVIKSVTDFQKNAVATCTTATHESGIHSMAMENWRFSINTSVYLNVYLKVPGHLQLKIPFSWPISFVEHWKSE